MFQMEYGREVELNLANIVINHSFDETDNNIASYDYLISKKVEELEFDRSEQLKRVIQNNPQLYSIETYLEEYERQTGNKISETQIQGVKKFEEKIRSGLLIGKYNLQDYITFFRSIPDLLSGKKFLAIGRYPYPDGEFWLHDEIDEIQSKEEISKYSTYTWHRIEESLFRPFSPETPSIRKRMKNLYNNYYLCDYYDLCAVDVKKMKIHMYSPEMQEQVKGDPNLICVGDRNGYYIFSDENGILFAGEKRPTIKKQTSLQQRDSILSALEAQSRGYDEAEELKGKLGQRKGQNIGE